ncbi:hypothetical protein ABT275_37230 [Streptomyces sp. NPDC001185]|uniref:hypothetical protein n=1 Tax=Streptomyces sp. NPDC001185 TaxID=3154380 RepID=UPI00331AE745
MDRGLALRLLLPHDEAQPANLLCTFQSDGLSAPDLLRQLELRRLLSGPGHFAAEIDGHPVISGRLPQTAAGDAAKQADFDAFASYIEDLDIVQRHTRLYFPVDVDIPWSHRLWVRRARLLVEGHCVTVPYRSFTVTLNGSDGSVLRSILSKTGCLKVGSDRSAIPVGPRILDLGPTETYHPQMTAENGPAALAALDTGRAEGFQVTYAVPEGQHLRTFFPATTPLDRPLAPVPLGLPGVLDLP